MDAHRLVSPDSLRIYDLENRFSCFDFVEKHFNSIPSARRIFSLARSFDACTLVIEDIQPHGIIQDENEEITTLYPDYTPGALKRLTFWKKSFKTERGIPEPKDEELIGYAVLKEDIVPSIKDSGCWHVFESVFPKYQHKHNCVPRSEIYNLAVGENKFSVKGIIYCQQNALNKCCAHVALRTLLSRILPEQDISYSQLNKIASEVSGPFAPKDGLNTQQIRRILDSLGIYYNDIDYKEKEKKSRDIRSKVPFQNYIYSGIESGCGGLLGFSMSGPKADEQDHHIIPFFGHTFNKDTWAPDADVAYFNIGGKVGYIPSSSWTSSFIGHDDNFGSNFCVPRLYMKPEDVQYVVEFCKKDVKYGGLIAEAQGLQFLYSIGPNLNTNNPWSRRLTCYSSRKIQRVVLRTLCVSRNQYVTHLKNILDSDGNREEKYFPEMLHDLLPDSVWIVEVSLPHLFPANEHKVGEIVLNAQNTRNKSKDADYGLFLIARFPEEYFLLKSVNQYGPSFLRYPSNIKTHVDLLRI